MLYNGPLAVSRPSTQRPRTMKRARPPLVSSEVRLMAHFKSSHKGAKRPERRTRYDRVSFAKCGDCGGGDIYWMNMTAAELHHANGDYMKRKTGFDHERYKLVFKDGVAVLAQRKYCWHCGSTHIVSQKGHKHKLVVRVN